MLIIILLNIHYKLLLRQLYKYIQSTRSFWCKKYTKALKRNKIGIYKKNYYTLFSSRVNDW